MAIAFLRSVAHAVLNFGTFGVGGLLAEALPKVAEAAWDMWCKEREEEQRREELEAIARAGVEAIRLEAAKVLDEIASGVPAERRQDVEHFLIQIPATIQRSLRRPSDPTGTHLPLDLAPKSSDALLPLLPERVSRFRPGMRPIGDWELECLLGVGGFGEVWKARNPHLSSAEPVALKFCLDPAAGRVLKNEAAMLDRVMRHGKHPGIVQLLRTHLSAEVPCLEYEYVEGGDLTGLIQDWHRTPGGPPLAEINKTFLALCEIVGFAHKLTPPIVHRDIKPANVLCQKADGVVLKVADFGIGATGVTQHATNQAATATGRFLVSSVLGSYTPLYASAQQMRGDRPTPADDVYALGVVWYQMLTGDLRQGRPGGTKWQRRLIERGMPLGVIQLLSECYEDRPADRPADAAALHAELDARLKAAAAKASSPAATKKAGKTDPASATDDELADFLRHKRWDVRKEAVEAIEKRKLRHLADQLLDVAMHDDDDEVRAAAFDVVVGWKAAGDEWVTRWVHANGADACARVIELIADGDADARLLNPLLRHPAADVREAALDALLDIDDDELAKQEWFRAWLPTCDPAVAPRLIKKFDGSDSELAVLIPLVLDHPDEGVANAAWTELLRIEPEDVAASFSLTADGFARLLADWTHFDGDEDPEREWFVKMVGKIPVARKAEILATLRTAALSDDLDDEVWSAGVIQKLAAWKELTEDVVRKALWSADADRVGGMMWVLEEDDAGKAVEVPNLGAVVAERLRTETRDDVIAACVAVAYRVGAADSHTADLLTRNAERWLSGAVADTRADALRALRHSGRRELAPLLVKFAEADVPSGERWRAYELLKAWEALTPELAARWESEKQLMASSAWSLSNVKVADADRVVCGRVLMERIRKDQDNYVRKYCLDLLHKWGLAGAAVLHECLRVSRKTDGDFRTLTANLLAQGKHRDLGPSLVEAVRKDASLFPYLDDTLAAWGVLPGELRVPWLRGRLVGVFGNKPCGKELVSQLRAGLAAAGVSADALHGDAVAADPAALTREALTILRGLMAKPSEGDPALFALAVVLHAALPKVDDGD